MGILDKEIKRIKAEDARLIKIFKLSGHLATAGYCLSDEGDSFSAMLIVELPDGKFYLDNRNLITRESYNYIEDKGFLDDLVDSGQFIIVDMEDDGK